MDSAAQIPDSVHLLYTEYPQPKGSHTISMVYPQGDRPREEAQTGSGSRLKAFEKKL